MLFFIAFVGAAIIVSLVLWRAMSATREDVGSAPHRRESGPFRPRVSGPDDDPDFLRQLDEKVRRRDDPPAA